MNYKVLCSDLDGTLLSTKDDVSDVTIGEIKRIRTQMRVVLVSARMPSAMYYLQDRLEIKDQPIICYNGALILDGAKELFSNTISHDVLSEVYRMTLSLEIDMGLYLQDKWFVPKSSKRVETEIKYTKTRPFFQDTQKTLSDLGLQGAHKVMLMCTKHGADYLMPILEINLRDNINIYRSNDTLIELAPKSVSKRSAIEHLLNPKETMENVIAFGDNYNDIEMLQAAGCGVAVANAREEVKRIADHIALANTKDGVADFIRRNILI